MTKVLKDDEALNILLGEFSPSDFFQSYWEQMPLCIKREGATPATGLLSAKKIDQILQFGSIKQPHFRVFRNGAAISPSHFSYSHARGRDKERGATKVSEIYRELNQGASLAVQFLEHLDDDISRFCSNLAASIGTRVQANAYLTLSNNQTLNHHYDMHDVLVLQIEGQKDWVVWDDPIYLAMRRPNRAQLRASSQRRVAASKVAFRGTLYPGDVLYVPRGFVHVASTSSQHSLHITFGLLIRRLHSVLKDAFEQIVVEMENQAEFRRSAFPLGRDTAAFSSLAQKVSEHMTDACLKTAINKAIVKAKGSPG